MGAVIGIQLTHNRGYVVLDGLLPNAKGIGNPFIGGPLSNVFDNLHVLRQDPDVILVGEMRDTETAAAVLNVAETGHLVLTTGHAPSAAQAIERIMDLFPPHERSLVQGQISSLILGVMCQVLVPTVDGSGRIAAVEVMLGITPVRNLIREGKTYQLPNVIRTHAQLGMITFDQALVNLYHGGEISKENLIAFCNDREEVERLSGNKLAPSPLSL